MTLKEFTEKVKPEVAVRLNNEVVVDEVQKLNGIRRYGLRILNPDTNIIPILYMEDYFYWYLRTGDWDDIIDIIINTYQDNMLIENFDITKYSDFSQIKDKIFYRLINYEKNEEMLRQMPHIKFLDLAKVFCVQHQMGDYGNAISSIRNIHLERWGIDAGELAAVAEANTPYLLPSLTAGMGTFMSALVEEYSLAEEEGDSLAEEILKSVPRFLYVMTNAYRSNGAGTICYPDDLKNFAGERDEDIIILPSSINEVLLLPMSEGMDLDKLKDTVYSVNKDVVEAEEFLSDNVYIYKRETGQIEIA